MRKPWKKYLCFSLVLVGISFFASFAYVSKQAEVKEQTALYIALAAQPLEGESSSYELQRAAEHFSDMVLGWTLEPGFELGEDLSFSGRRQEKQNLLFVIDSSEESDGLLLLEAIESRINTYNSLSNAQYVIALHSISDVDQVLNRSRIIFGALLLTFIASVAMIFTYDSYRSHRR